MPRVYIKQDKIHALEIEGFESPHRIPDGHWFAVKFVFLFEKTKKTTEDKTTNVFRISYSLTIDLHKNK